MHSHGQHSLPCYESESIDGLDHQAVGPWKERVKTLRDTLHCFELFQSKMCGASSELVFSAFSYLVRGPSMTSLIGNEGEEVSCVIFFFPWKV